MTEPVIADVRLTDSTDAATVICEDAAPTSSVGAIVRTSPTCSTRSFCSHSLNPLASICNLYVEAAILSIRKYPAWLVTTVLSTPRRVSVRVTFASAISAPEVSCAVPSIPLENWAKTGVTNRKSRADRMERRLVRMTLSIDSLKTRMIWSVRDTAGTTSIASCLIDCVSYLPMGETSRVKPMIAATRCMANENTHESDSSRGRPYCYVRSVRGGA